MGHDPSAFCEAIDAVSEQLRRGDRVLMHCAAGIGRTGAAAACVLKRLGLTVAAALDTVQRAGSNPQSAAQTGLIQLF